MKINLDAPTEEVRIEIVPLIDVIFCILTFFILAAVGLSRQQAINVDLPKASTGIAQMEDMFLVSIDPIGQLYIEQEAVTQSQIYERLKQHHSRYPDGLIVLHASRSATYNDVIQVLDLLRSVGGDRVALATLPGDGKLPDGTSPDGLQFDPLSPDGNFNDPFNRGNQFNDPLSPGNPGSPFNDPLNPLGPQLPGRTPSPGNQGIYRQYPLEPGDNSLAPPPEQGGEDGEAGREGQ